MENIDPLTFRGSSESGSAYPVASAVSNELISRCARCAIMVSVRSPSIKIRSEKFRTDYAREIELQSLA